VDEFFSKAPKIFIAIISIVAGLGLIVAIDPPATICQAQIEIFSRTQKSFLYESKEKGIVRPALIKVLLKECQDGASPGSCFEFFDHLRKLSIDLENIPRNCSEAVGDESGVKNWLKKSLKVIVQLAWGERAPESQIQRNGWLDNSDIALYCSLRARIIQIYGNGNFIEWRDGVLSSLPNAMDLGVEDRWQRSLFSIPCDSFR
jgi:hypothetical protein